MRFLALLAFLCLICASLAASDNAFSASVEIRNPKAPGSVVEADLQYNHPASLLRVQYKGAGGSVAVTEVTNFSTKMRFRVCSKCESSYTSAQLPEFFLRDEDTSSKTDSTLTIGGKECLPFDKANKNQPVRRLWCTAEKDILCRADFADGREFTFVRVDNKDPPASVFAEQNSCPPPICKKPLDLVLVMDETGSIQDDEWKLMKKWAMGIVNSFEVGPTATNIGLAYFSGRTYKNGEDPATCCGIGDHALPLTDNKAAIANEINGHLKKGGHTCIGCGIDAGRTTFPNKARSLDADRAMVVLTDGFNNRQTNFFQDDIDNARQAGIQIFAVGVGKTYSPQQLRQIASSPDNVFEAKNFGQLQKLVSKISKRVCTSFVDEPPCAGKCLGVCACGDKCVCPTTCEHNKCQTAVCVNGKFNSLCKVEDKKCAIENNKCAVATCDPADGKCKAQKLEGSLCDDHDPCTVDTCDPKVGCQHTKCAPRNNNACEVARCNPSSGCEYSTRSCDDGNPCTADRCDPVAGCVHTPVAGPTCSLPCRLNCDDNNPCTVDKCVQGKCVNEPVLCSADPNDRCSSSVCKADPGSPKGWSCQLSRRSCDDGNPCSEDKCDPATGSCVYSAITCATTGDKCLSATCDPKKGGCVSTRTKCDDGNPCTVDRCNPATGKCEFAPVQCKPSLEANGCSVAKCDAATGKCIETPRVCGPPKDSCHKSVCSSGQCQQQVIEGTVDACGVCGGDGSTCVKQQNEAQSDESSTAITTGVIAGVVIGAAAVAGALALALGFCLNKAASGGAQVLNDAGMGSAHDNPLFEQDTLDQQNPLFAGM